MSSPKRPDIPVARPVESSQSGRRTTRLNILPEVESDPALLPSANERWLQFSRWLLYHRTELRATQYVYGAPDDIPGATNDEAQKALRDLALWDDASTPPDGLPAFFEEALGLSVEAPAGLDGDGSATPGEGEALSELELLTDAYDAEYAERRSNEASNEAPNEVPNDEWYGAAPEEAQGLFGRARRRLRRVRKRLRDVRDLL